MFVQNDYLTFVGFKPFTCEICNKSFRTSGHLKNHESAHYQGAERGRRMLVTRGAKGDEVDTSHIELQVNRCLDKELVYEIRQVYYPIMQRISTGSLPWI